MFKEYILVDIVRIYSYESGAVHSVYPGERVGRRVYDNKGCCSSCCEALWATGYESGVVLRCKCELPDFKYVSGVVNYVGHCGADPRTVVSERELESALRSRSRSWCWSLCRGCRYPCPRSPSPSKRTPLPALRREQVSRIPLSTQPIAGRRTRVTCWGNCVLTLGPSSTRRPRQVEFAFMAVGEIGG